ncbi:hypothetical protein MNEG_15912 [Monoraphidium neglectum]|uniref:Hydroxyproline O-arabinosyltransferase-like domain-containing protein n=1 Tax=Monoraphidium neglectum TaxID=145388 RepID=A0A0D2LQ23_9CHLO|nr:hypothetical protein MNEG_15912 [Monoraphidium neglectum]KIY92051.1 hypothetical protein MNEG_15912 [Monoraphidium neglectum]|eukprot:XP_013891071.1 hypothetical protein MNEG_15912 [Monoraphidium neglectum]
MLLGFSSGILTGFIYQQHKQIGAGLSQTDASHPASRLGFDAAPPGPTGQQGEITKHGFQIVRHDFSSSSFSNGGGSSGSSGGAGGSSGASGSGSGGSQSTGGAPQSSSGDGSGGAGAGAITVGGPAVAAGAPVRTSRYSNSNKTALTRSDMKRIGGALQAAARRHGGDTIHTLFTSNGSPYQNIQGRIMYASYKLVQKMPGGEKLTGFTRILHRTTDDAVVGEVGGGF